jgi:hypothetical protein
MHYTVEWDQISRRPIKSQNVFHTARAANQKNLKKAMREASTILIPQSLMGKVQKP